MYLNAAELNAADPLIALALAEDLSEMGDITTQAICREDQLQQVDAVIRAKSAGIVAGIEIVARVFQRAQPPVIVDCLVADDQKIDAGKEVVRLFGPVSSLLACERTALNFLQRLSGIATLTRRFVEAVAETRAVILDTRKTTPGWRLLEKYAVRCGGGRNHRLGLHDMFLVKENHIAAAGGIAPAVRQCRELARERSQNWQVEVEVRTLAEVEACLRAGVDRIMLDNMSYEEMRTAVALVAGRVPLEASGNVSLQNVSEIAVTGVDFISIGALTHSAPAMDFSLLVQNK